MRFVQVNEICSESAGDTNRFATDETKVAVLSDMEKPTIERISLPAVEAARMKVHDLLINLEATEQINTRRVTTAQARQAHELLERPDEELLMTLYEEPANRVGDRFFIFSVGGSIGETPRFQRWQIRW